LRLGVRENSRARRRGSTARRSGRPRIGERRGEIEGEEISSAKRWKKVVEGREVATEVAPPPPPPSPPPSSEGVMYREVNIRVRVGREEGARIRCIVEAEIVDRKSARWAGGRGVDLDLVKASKEDRRAEDEEIGGGECVLVESLFLFLLFGALEVEVEVFLEGVAFAVLFMAFDFFFASTARGRLGGMGRGE